MAQLEGGASVGYNNDLEFDAFSNKYTTNISSLQTAPILLLLTNR